MINFIKSGAAACCIVFLASCGGGGDDKPASQVAAKVNGDEISVHQINNALARSGAASPEQAKAVTGRILDGLIDQQLLIQKATETKLDRDANVVTAIENSRRQILSQAYMERAAGNVPKPSQDEIAKYYAENPQLFAKRRIYRFQEFVATVTPEQLKSMQAQVEKTRNLNEIANWMKAQNIAFGANFSIRAAEQLPMEQLPRFQAMKAGEISVFPGGNRVLVTQLIAVQEAPLSEKEATPFIERFLFNQRRAEYAAAEVKKLRDAAKVEYVGDYAKLAAAPAPSGKQPEAPVAPAPVEGKGSIEKGLSGL